jgi:hypothetical protein
MKAYGGVGVHIQIFFTSALAGGEWSTSRPGRFTPGERAPRTHWIGDWVDPEPVWTTWRIENSWPYRDSNSNTSVIQPVACRYTDHAILALLLRAYVYKIAVILLTTKKNYPCNRPWRPIGFWEVEVPQFSRQSAHRWRWGCQPYALVALYPQKVSWYSFC